MHTSGASDALYGMSDALCGASDALYGASGALYDSDVWLLQLYVKPTPVPTCGPSDQQYMALQVCCGARHTAVRSSQGELFAWGWNKYGQLGLGDTTNRLLPQQMLTNASVSNVECGWWHTVVVYDTAKL